MDPKAADSSLGPLILDSRDHWKIPEISDPPQADLESLDLQAKPKNRRLRLSDRSF